MSAPWPMTPLGEVLKRVERYEPREELVEYQFAGTYSFGRGIFVSQNKQGSEFKLDKLQRIHAGDFVYCKIMAWEGAFGVVPVDADKCVMSGAFVAYEIDPTKLDSNFLAYYFKLPSVWQVIGSRSTGTNIRRRSLHPDQLECARIPLPPLEEQRRIVARIQALAAKIDEARGVRRKLEAETQLLATNALNPVFGDDEEDIRGQLDAVDRVSLDRVIIDVADGPHVTPHYVESGVPFVTVQNITSGRVNFIGAKRVTVDDHRFFQKRAKAERGDVLISKDGSIGFPCYVDTDDEFSFFVSVALIKPRKELLDGRYLVWAIRSPTLQKQINKRSRGDMIRHLVLREIRRLVIPLPPLAEQRRIVTHLDNLQAKVDALKQLQARTAAELDALLPSVLDKAFNGTL